MAAIQAPRRDACEGWGVRLFLGLALVLHAPFAQTQAHERRVEDYVVRSSVVSSQAIDAATARLHGIEPAARRAVLNVVVLRKHAHRFDTVPASVNASVRNLAGVRQQISVRDVPENGRVSYLGAFDFALGEVLDFQIQVRPIGARQSIGLSYRERMWAQ